MGNITKITSKENGTFKALISLQKSSKRRKEDGVFILEGLRLCSDAFNNGYVPVATYFSTTAIKKYQEAVQYFSEKTDIFELSDNLFSKVSDTVSPQGILCIFRIPDFSDIEIRKNGRYIALDNLQDPSNLGAISRTAEAFGLDGIIVNDGCDPYSPKSLRASMGALLRIPVIQTKNMFELFKKAELTVFASVVEKENDDISKMDFKDGCVVIIGNEANGISDFSRENADRLFTISMKGNAESLNAAVAASIIMWEMSKC